MFLEHLWMFLNPLLKLEILISNDEQFESKEENRLFLSTMKALILLYYKMDYQNN